MIGWYLGIYDKVDNSSAIFMDLQILDPIDANLENLASSVEA